ncbi:alpha-2-HS-glycoprotein-like [Nerophis lumbriciformis]|uniref:alpha-2-HS-glycoprotein-like n=1 Tax=Nerophis lumbriciformis TaxID=546530 RepID=UPI002ADFEF80|nr:alpha-2-HS-glycoprotein-like [Nerophis lumbriciformis]
MLAHLLAALLACVLLPADAVTPTEDITCHHFSVGAAANFAVRHIDEHHQHGYKFKLGEIQGNKYEQTADGCNIDLQLALRETRCHFTNPKAVEDCEVLEMSEGGAAATCTVVLRRHLSGTTVTRHQCTTTPAHSSDDMMMCPDCPRMRPLNDPAAVMAVQEAVQKYNQESNNQHYFALLEIGRVLSGYIPSVGMVTYPKFILVETNCPKDSRVACTPRCPHRAQHAVCSTSSSKKGVKSPQCELFPAKDSTALEVEPQCGSSFHQSPEAAACTSQLTNTDPALHQICPFPLAVQLPQQEAL